jgi:hypothetical protein
MPHRMLAGLLIPEEWQSKPVEEVHLDLIPHRVETPD